MTLTQEITLDIYEPPYFQYVNAKQADNISRVLIITLTANGDQLKPNAESEVAVFRALKPDGTYVLNPATIGEDGKVTVKLTDQTLAKPGKVEADVSIVNGNEILSSATMYIQVTRAPVSDKQITSTDEFLLMTQATADASAATSRANDAAKFIEDMTVSASKVAAGGTPTAKLTKSSGHYNLALGLVTGDKGNKGDKGDAATITIAETVTGKPGDPAKVENVGTPTDPKLKFTIPLGNQGPVSSVNGQTGSIAIGGTNLLKNSRDPRVLGYGGQSPMITKNIAFPEIEEIVGVSVNDAINYKGRSGTSTLAFYLQNEAGYARFVSGVDYCMSVFAKNNGSTDISIGRFKLETLAPGETKRVVVVDQTTSSSASLQMQFKTVAVNTDYDITIWHPQIEIGNTATDWSPAPEDKADVPLRFDVSLPASGWANGQQTVKDARFLTGDQYAYLVDLAGQLSAADDVTVAGQMTFHADVTPTGAVTVDIIRLEVSS